jgi:glyoxylase-like metal-dependent hydrolase (beta-lactamase superfamily II)
VRPKPLHAYNPGPLTGAGNWTWLIGGRVPTLIDAGVGMPRHLDELEKALHGASLAQVLITHAHSDHVDGVMALAARMPAVKFLKMPWPERDRAWPVAWQSLADGDRVEIGDVSATVVHTPGHAPDHVCVWHPETGTLFGGDLAIEGTTVWIPSLRAGDLSAYLSSLERVIALNPSWMLPAHGPIITRPITLLRAYVAHRRERERQIIDALRHGDTRAAAIVARVYPKLAKGLVPRAEETVLAHLQKLEHDGLARRTDDAWHIIDR